MKKTIYTTLSVAIIFLGVLSCKGNRLGDVDRTKEPVVTVLENTLYMSDLEDIIYYGMSSEDSIVATQSYIKMWINDQLIYDKAKQNISNKKEIDDLVEEYRRSLIVNDYQTRLLKERLAKTVPDSELQNFFTQNKDRFKLSEHVIKGLYLKVPVQSPQLENFEKWFKLGTDEAVGNIEKNMLQNVIGYEYFYDKWVSLNNLLDNVPEIITDSEAFLKNNKSYTVRDSSFVYMLHIKEYKLQGGEAPYEFIKENLTDAYIERKRDQYLKQLQSDLYNKALSSDQIKYYTE